MRRGSVPPKNPYKSAEFERARQLRSSGMSMRKIATKLGLPQSTISLWTRDVELTAQQRETLRAASAINSRIGTESSSRKRFAERLKAQGGGRLLAQIGDPLYLAGCMLYWAEGAKGRNQLAFTNSDPAMMRLFRRFLHEGCNVSPERMKLTVNCFLGNGLSLEEIERFWLDELQLPDSSLCTSVVNRASRASLGKRRPLLYGTARLTVSSTALVQEIFGAIQHYGGFDRPEWARSPTQAA